LNRIKSSLLERTLGIEFYITNIPSYLSLDIKLNPNTFNVYEVFENIPVNRHRDVAKLLNLNKTKRTYAYAVLYKKNIDTIQAIAEISKKFNVPQNDIEFCGLKDAHATTYQLISIPSKYLSNCSIGSIISIDNHIELLIIGYSDRPLKKGAHLGNYFTIVVEASSSLIDKIKEALKALQALDTYPNYYGIQRFGTIRPITHVIGKFILKRAWDEVVKYIIAYSFPQENSIIRRARILSEEGNFKEALREYPKSYYEAIILRELIKSGNSLKALKRMPRQYIMLFVNAFQSYLFNRILSRIIELYDSYTQYINGMVKCISPLGDIRPCIPLVGLGMKVDSKSELHHIINEVLSIEGISIDDFNVKDLGIKVYSRPRPMYIPIINFKWHISEKDDKVILHISFVLERGAYATNILREITNYNIDKMYT